MSFFIRYEFFYEKQYAYLRNTGTNVALVELVDELCKSVDSQDVVTGVFLDLSKAFDAIPHHVLIHKLQSYGIRGNQLKLMESYLSNRRQFVSLDGVNSEIKAVNLGVPQGSVLGPLLFVIFINEIGDLDLFGEVYLYADDTSITYAANDVSINIHHANLDMQTLVRFFCMNGLTVNISKTYCVHFRPRQRVLISPEPILLFDHAIQVKNSTKFLRVHVDQHLIWKTQLDHLTSVLSRTAGIMYKLRRILPEYTKTQI